MRRPTFGKAALSALVLGLVPLMEAQVRTTTAPAIDYTISSGTDGPVHCAPLIWRTMRWTLELGGLAGADCYCASPGRSVYLVLRTSTDGVNGIALEQRINWESRITTSPLGGNIAGIGITEDLEDDLVVMSVDQDADISFQLNRVTTDPTWGGWVDSRASVGEALIRVRIDGEGPVVRALEAGPFGSPSFGLSFSLRDGESGPSGAKLSIDGRAVASILEGAAGDEERILRAKADGMAEGRHVWFLQAADELGNKTQAQGTIVVDLSPPRLSPSLDPSSWTSGQVIARPNASDSLSAISSLEASIDGAPYQALGQVDGSPGLRIPAGEGPLSVRFRARNAAGKEAEARMTVTNRDGSPPLISLPPSGWLREARLRAEAEDALSGLEEGSWRWREAAGQWRWERDALLSEGPARRVEFAVSDRAGNAASAAGSWGFDGTAPLFDAELPPLVGPGGIVFRSFALSDPLSGLARVEWQLDEGPWLPWPEPWEGRLPLPPSLAEGPHSFSARARDRAGNQRLLPRGAFCLDLSPPPATVLGISQRPESGAGGEALEPGQWLSSRLCSVEVTNAGSLASLLPLPGGSRKEAISYAWRLEGDPAWRRGDSPSWELELREGENLLHVRALDEAGNEGPLSSLRLRVDAERPGPPGLSGKSHPRATRDIDAARPTTALFDVLPGSSGLSGLASIGWRLLCGSRPLRAGELSPRGGRLCLEGLALNEPGEFYDLEVFGRSAAGREGEASSWRFRVDDQPPEFLKLSLLPQVDPEAWYGEAMLRLSWEGARDGTGIRSCRWRALHLSAEDGLPAYPAAEEDLGSWKEELSAAEAWCDGSALLGGEGIGRVGFLLCAQDWAGNRSWARAAALLDLRAPEFPAAVGAAPALEEGEEGLILSWESATDQGSGLSGYALSLRRLDREEAEERFVAAGEGGGRKEALMAGEGGAALWFVDIRALDRAGNEARSTGLLATGGMEIPPLVERPLDEWLGAWHVEGRLLSEPSGQILSCLSARLSPPEDLRFALPGGEQPTAQLALELEPESLRFDGASRPRSAFLRASALIIEGNGPALRGSSPSWTAEEGLVLEPGLFSLDCVGGARSLRASRASSGIRPEEGPFSAEASFEGPQAMDLRAGGAFLRVEGVDGARLEGGGAARLFGRGLSFRAPEGSPLRGGSSEAVGLDWILIGGGNQLEAAALSPGAVLSLEGMDFSILNSVIEGSTLRVGRALWEGGGRSLLLHDIAIELPSCRLSLLPAFGFEGLPAAWEDGSPLEDLRWTWSEEGGLSASGSVGGDGSAWSGLRFEGLRLGVGGWDRDAGLRLSGSPAFFPAGFRLVAERARLVGMGCLVERGSLFLGEAPFSVADVGLGFDGRSLWSPGRLLEPASIDAGWGSPCVLRALRLAEGGSLADLDLPVDASLFTGRPLGVLPLRGVTLLPGPRFSADAVLKAERLRLADCILSVDFGFRGGHLASEAIRIQELPGLCSPLPAFSGLELDASGLRSEALAEGEAVWARDGWTLSFGQARLGPAGLHGAARLRLPPALGGASHDTGELLLLNGLPRGALSPEGGWMPLMSGGWLFRLREASFQLRGGECLLSCASLGLDLSAFGAGEASLGAASLHADGRLEALSGSLDAPLEGRGGWRLDAGNLSFRDGRALVSGGLSFPSWEGGPRALEGEFELRPDGSLAGTVSGSLDAFTLCGYPARAASLEPRPEGSLLGSCALRLGEAWLELGDLELDARGRPRARRSLDASLAFPAAWGDIEADGAELGPGGLSFDGWIALPEALGGGSARIEDFGLDARGRLSASVSVEDLSLEFASLRLSLKNLRVAPEGMSAARASLSLPGLEEGIALRDVRIDGGGPSFAGASIEPFRLWGMDFSLDGLSWGAEGLSFSGAVGLPADLPGGLGGRVLRIIELSVGRDGLPRAFSLGVDGAFGLPLPCGFSASLSGLRTQWSEGMRLPRLVAERAALALPQGLGRAELVMRGLALDLDSGEPDFSGMEMEGSLSVAGGGFLATLTGLSVDEGGSLAFSGDVCASDPSRLPAFMRAARLELSECRLEAGRGLAGMVVRATGLDGPLSEWLDLDQASAEFSLLGDERSLSLSGGLLFGAKAPPGLEGKGLRLISCRYDLEGNRLLSLEAEGGPFEFDTAAGRVVDAGARLSLAEGGSGLFLSLSGGLLLPESLPGVLSLARADLEELSFQEGTGLLGLRASFSSAGPVPLFSVAGIRDLQLRAGLEDGLPRYSLKGRLVLGGSSFPSCLKGLAGTELVLEKLLLNEEGKPLEAAGSINLPRIELSPGVFLENGRLGLGDASHGPSRLEAGGRLVLGPGFPAGLGGTVFDLERLGLDLGGGNPVVMARASLPRVEILPGKALLRQAVISASADAEEFLFGASGRLELLAEGLPGDLDGAAFDLKALLVSNKRGLLALDAGLDGGLDIPLGAFATARLESLSLDPEGFGGSGSLGFDGGGPEGLNDFTARVDAFSMGWDGSLKELAGGAKQAKFEIGGFRVESGAIILDEAGVAFSLCRLFLPENMGSLGGAGIGLGGVRWDFERARLEAGIEGGRVEAYFAGFALCLEGARIDQGEKKISFDKALLKMPAFIGGGSVALEGLSLQPGGLRTSGGAFSLPDFSLPGGLGFRALHAEFRCLENRQDGEWFSLGASGSVLLPGVGCLEAELSFANRCSLYPIGLKRAYFEFSATGKGLPLGSSGIFLNAVSGGLAYGPPEELPDALAGAFGPEGPRLQLGLRLVDASAGKVFSADAEAWIDLGAAAFAFAGDAALFRGSLDIKAEFEAAWGRYGFYAGMGVELALVRGRLELRVFDADGASRVAGRGSVSLGFEKGSLFSCRWFSLPKEKFWLGGLKAEFGSFLEKGADIRGFKAFVDLPFLGQMGVFTDGKGIRLGDLSAIQLRECPSRSAAMEGAPGRRDLAFTVGSGRPGGALFLALGRDPERGSLGKLSAVLRSPSGEELDALALPMEKSSNGLMIRIDDPEAGEWSLRLRADDPQGLEAVLLSRSAPPAILVREPAADCAGGSGSVDVRGEIAGACEPGSRLVLGLSPLDGGGALGPCGPEAAPRIELDAAEAAAEGAFSLKLDCASLPEGRYAIFVRLDRGGILPSVEARAPAVLSVSHEGELLPMPRGLTVATEGDMARLSWNRSGRAVVRGYRLFWEGSSQGGQAWLGDLSSVSLPGFGGAGEMTFRLRAEDSGGRAGLPSEPVTAFFGDETSEADDDDDAGEGVDPVEGGDASEGDDTGGAGGHELAAPGEGLTGGPAEPSWSQEAGGGGSTRAWQGLVADRALPQAYRPGKGIKGMVEGEGLLWFRTEKGLGSFDPVTGRGRDFETGPLSWMGWAGQGLWALDASGRILRMRADERMDRELKGLWHEASSDGRFLCLRSSNAWNLLDGRSGGRLCAPLDARPEDRILAWKGGRPLIARGRRLLALGPGGAEILAEGLPEAAALALDDRGAAFLGGDGSLRLFDPAWRVLASLGPDEKRRGALLALEGEELLVAGRGGSFLLSRLDGDELWKGPPARGLALARGFAYLLGEGGLLALDRGSGGLSSLHEGNCGALALPAGRLAFISEEGELFLSPP